MAPSIDSMVFRLRRMYATERSQLAAYEFVDDVMRHWDSFANSDGEVIDFMRGLWPTDAYLPNRDYALAYLVRCHAKGERPDRSALTVTLLPWYLDD